MNSVRHGLRIPPVFEVLNLLLQTKNAEPKDLQQALSTYQENLAVGAIGENEHFAPMVLNRLHVRGLEACASNALLELLRQAARVAAAHSIGRDVAINTLADAFDKAGCRAVLLKGAALDGYLYQRQDFRLGVDVDVLLSSQDYERVDGILGNTVAAVEAYPDRAAHRGATEQRSFIFDKPSPLSVDVHRQFAQSEIYAVDYDALFERSMAHGTKPSPLRVLAPEDNLLHFALHGFKDKCLFQKQTVDAWMLLQKESLDWGRVLARARAWGVTLPLVYLLEGVKQAFAYECPNAVRPELELTGMRRTLAYRLLGEKPPAQRRTGFHYRVKQLGITWLLSGNLSGNLRYQARYLSNRLRDGLGGG